MTIGELRAKNPNVNKIKVIFTFAGESWNCVHIDPNHAYTQLKWDGCEVFAFAKTGNTLTVIKRLDFPPDFSP